MKFSLTIATDNAADLAGILAHLGGSSASVTTITQPTFAAATAQPIAPAVADGSDGPADPNAPAFDSAGLPWDERIHAASKTTNKDGTWRSKRGVSDTTIAVVTAELRSRGAAPATPYQPPAQPEFTAPATPYQPPAQPEFTAPAIAPVQQFQAPPVQQFQAPPVQQFQAPPVQQFQAPPVQQFQAPPAQPEFTAPPVAPVAPVQTEQPQGMEFGAFMGVIQRGMTTLNPNTGTPYIDQTYIASLVARLSQHLQRQLNAITDIYNDPNAISVAASMLQQDGRWL